MIAINVHENKLKLFKETYLDNNIFKLILSGFELMNYFDFEEFESEEKQHKAYCCYAVKKLENNHYFRFIQIDEIESQDTIFNNDDLHGIYKFYEVI